MKVRAAALVCLLAVGCKSDPPLDVADGVELQRFEGKWYEIAKLPRSTQRDCENTTSSYHLRSDTELDVVNECERDGTTTQVVARAVVSDGDVPAKLSIDFGAFYGDYWIIEVGEEYEYAVVGHPTRDYLWLLSRTPSLPADTLNGVVQRASDRHFDVARLEYTKQAEVSAEDARQPAPAIAPREYGCAVRSAGGQGNETTLGGFALALALAAARKRRGGGV